MVNYNKPGDIHAPIEDTEVPGVFKFFVIVMGALLLATTVAVSLVLQANGLPGTLF